MIIWRNFRNKVRALSDAIAKPKSKKEADACFVILCLLLCVIGGLGAWIILTILVQSGILVTVLKGALCLIVTAVYLVYLFSSDDPIHAMGRAILGVIIIVFIIGLLGQYKETELERWERKEKWGGP